MKRSRLSHFGASGHSACAFAEEHRTDFGAAERQAQVAGIAGVDGIHGEATGFIGGLGKQGCVHGKIGRAGGWARQGAAA